MIEKFNCEGADEGEKIKKPEDVDVAPEDEEDEDLPEDEELDETIEEDETEDEEETDEVV